MAFRWSVSCVLLGAALLQGCAGDATSGPQTSASLGIDGCAVGAGMGAVAGGLAGHFLNQQFGRSNLLYQLGAPTLGATAGGWVGYRIGCALNAQDRQRAEQAVALTTSSGRPQRWSSPDSGASGEARVVASAGNCRIIEQVVTLANGDRRTEQVRACRNGQGSWEVQA